MIDYQLRIRKLKNEIINLNRQSEYIRIKYIRIIENKMKLISSYMKADNLQKLSAIMENKK